MRLMLFFALTTSLSNAAALPPCADTDIGCFKLHLVDQLLQIQDLTQQRDSLASQLTLAGATNKVLLDAATAANGYAQKIAAEGASHWYTSPVLWFALGFFIAGAAAIGLAAAISHVTR